MIATTQSPTGSGNPEGIRLPAAAEQALADYVLGSMNGTLKGECRTAPGPGFCYFNLNSTDGGFAVTLGRVGSGLPTWQVQLLADAGAFRVGQVVENKGRE